MIAHGKRGGVKVAKQQKLILMICFSFIQSICFSGLADESKLYDKLFPVIDPKYRIVHEDLYYPTFDFKNNQLYYFGGSELSGIYSFDLLKKTTKLIIKIDDISGLEFSPDFKSAVVSVSYDGYRFKKYGSPFLAKGIEDGELTFWYVDFMTKKIFLLDRSIQSFCWKNNHELIVHYHNWNIDPEINYIGICNIYNKSVIKLINQSFYEVKFLSISKECIYFIQQPTEFQGADKVYEFNFNTKKMNRFTDQSNIYDIKFSPDNNYCLILAITSDQEESYGRIFDLNTRKFIRQTNEYSIEYGYYDWNSNNTVSLISRDRTGCYYLNIIFLGKQDIDKVKLDINPKVEVQRIWAKGNDLFLLANDFIYEMKF